MTDPTADALIELRGVRREFQQGTETVHALRPTSLRIEQGEFVAIVGPSGSGKSTLMYVLGCLDSPTDGEFYLAGQEVGALADAALSKARGAGIGYVFQQFFLLGELTVVENIALGLAYAGVERSIRQERATELAEQMGLGHRLNHRPLELSGGQMQRTAIARALAVRPHLVLADEPTGALDSKTGQEIMEIFRDLHARGRTIVLITHDRSVAEQADRIITLVDGEIQSDERLRERPSTPPATTFGIAAVAGAGATGVTGDIVPGVPAEAVDTSTHSQPAVNTSTKQQQHWVQGDGSRQRMRARDLVRTALREGLLAHKLRSLLTMMGIVFGIAAVIVMTAITEGGKQQQLQTIAQIGLTTIQVNAEDLTGAGLLEARRINPLGLTRDDAQALVDHIPDVQNYSMQKEILAEIRVDREIISGMRTFGIGGAWPAVTGIQVQYGRFLDAVDQQNKQRVVVIGTELANRILAVRGQANAGLDALLGQHMLLGDAVVTIIGILPTQAGGDSGIRDLAVPDRNRHCYVPLESALAIFPQPDRASELDQIVLNLSDPDQLLDRSQQVQALLRGLHDGADDVSVSVPLQTLQQAQATKEMFNVIIVIIAGISLIVGGIGIMNIMLASVTERTREIGIRRAIGATRGDVMRQFLAEACVLSLGGGLLGIGAGFIGAQVLSIIFELPVAIRPAIVVTATGVSVVIGISFGLYPAWQAAHRDPVEALRV